ncbi:uncharacterized protein LOC128325837 [Hemicordylus capensis]|uniref:uncharacterized protein LOC128325837 n=1 Tax=Hemicordylus capensis TaxID=884348 RepID=UPI002302203E|nr:uncharacterized protein LOC128325837 [Hemicordylus capensis]
MPPKKARGKTGGQPTRPPRQPVPQPSSSDEDDVDMAQIRGFIQRMVALEQAKKDPSDNGAGPSGVPSRPGKRTRGAVKVQLLKSLSDRLTSLESRAAPVKPVDGGDPSRLEPSSPAGPVPVEMPTRVQSVLVDPSGGSDSMPGGQIQGPGTRNFGRTRAHARSPVAAWQVKTQQAIEASLAPSIRVGYFTKVAAFAVFRKGKGLPEVWPVPPAHIMQFLVHLHEAGRVVSTLAGYVSALFFTAQAMGVADSTGDCRVCRMLECWARGLPKCVDQRQPLTFELVTTMVDRLQGACSSEWEVILFRAATLVSFGGAFRPSKVLPRSGRASRERWLQFQDLLLKDAEAPLLLRSSKADQRAKGQVVVLSAASDPGVCPVAMLWRYLALQPYTEGCLFVHMDGRPLTQFQLWSVPKVVLSSLGESMQDFSLHNFRIGAATTGSRLGLPDAAVRRIGWWRSKVFLRYVR